MRGAYMDDLTDGCRVWNPVYRTGGTVRVVKGRALVTWDGDHFGEIEISDNGPVFPEDVEIVTGGETP